MSTQAGTLPNKTETVTPAASKEGHVKLSWREKSVTVSVTLGTVSCST